MSSLQGCLCVADHGPEFSLLSLCLNVCLFVWIHFIVSVAEIFNMKTLYGQKYLHYPPYTFVHFCCGAEVKHFSSSGRKSDVLHIILF